MEFTKSEYLNGKDNIAVTINNADKLSVVDWNNLKAKTSGALNATVEDTLDALYKTTKLNLGSKDTVVIKDKGGVIGSEGQPTLVEFENVIKNGLPDKVSVTASIKGESKDIKGSLDQATDTITIDLTDTLQGNGASDLQRLHRLPRMMMASPVLSEQQMYNLRSLTYCVIN